MRYRKRWNTLARRGMFSKVFQFKGEVNRKGLQSVRNKRADWLATPEKIWAWVETLARF